MTGELPPTEIENQIIWFTDLREELDKGNYKAGSDNRSYFDVGERGE